MSEYENPGSKSRRLAKPLRLLAIPLISSFMLVLAVGSPLTAGASTPQESATTTTTTTTASTTTTTAVAAPTACDTAHSVTGISFAINGVSFKNLEHNVNSGDSVVANFTVAPGCTATLSLTSHTAPGPTFSAGQTVWATKTGTFTAGPGSLGPITVPPCFFQIDFALRVTSGSKTTFTSLNAANGGTSACVAPAVTPAQVCNSNNVELTFANTGVRPDVLTVHRSGQPTFVQTVMLTPQQTLTETYTMTAGQPDTFTAVDTQPTPFTFTKTFPAPSVCPTVLGNQITPTVAAVSVAATPAATTLPFTGFPTALSLALAAGLALSGGAIVALAARRRQLAD